MKYRILGPVEVWNGGQWTSIGATKQRDLLAMLLLRPGQTVERDRLIDVLWNGRPPSSSSRLLAHYVWRLRDLLPDRSHLRTTTSGYLLAADDDDIDLGRFTAAVAAAQAATTDRDHAGAVDRLTAALRLWRGPALADARLLPALDGPAQWLDQRRLEAREALALAQVAAGRPAEAVADLEVLVTEEPFREEPWRLLLLALHGAARRSEALAAYRRLCRLWTDELGTEPGSTLRELHRRILDDDPLPIRRPEAPAAPRPAQLPTDPPWFTGRADDVRELVAAIRHTRRQNTAVSVAVVHGMAGVGKTTLAIHVAHRLAPRYPDGQLFIDLHGFTDGVAPVPPMEALGRMLSALGIAGTAIPSHVDDRAALWRTLLAERRMLVLLDNAASEAQVQPLLPASSRCAVLVTSRSSLLGLDSTRSLFLDVMSVEDARSLFRDTVGPARVAEAPEQVTEIVELCGRLPLAIRVAAARLAAHATWTPDRLAERLRDRRGRLGELVAGQRSVAAAVDVSYRQLDPVLRRTYWRLGLHPGADFDVPAAAALADAAVPVTERVLDRLAAVHLLQEHAAGRYRLHDLLRSLAGRLAEAEEAAAAREAALTRLFEHYGRAAERAVATLYPHQVRRLRITTPEPGVEDPQRAERWLDAELDNLVAVINHAAGSSPEAVLRLSAVLDYHLRVRSRHTIAEAVHGLALIAARDRHDRRAEADALNGMGYARRLLGRPQAAEDDFATALPLARDAAHRSGEMEALQGLGHAHRAHGRYDAAVACFQSALDIAREIGHLPGALPALQGLGYVYRIQGRLELAADHFEQALTVAQKIGHRSGELGALSGLGYVHRACGRLAAAADRFGEALDVAWKLRHHAAEVGALWGIAQVRYAQRRYDEARARFAEAAQLAREIGDRNGQFEGEHGLGLIRSATGQPDRALHHHRDALSLATDLNQPVDQARALYGLAVAHRALGRQDLARRYALQALDLFERLGVSEVEELSLADLRAGADGRSAPEPR
jgi:DNA-binding SARP family transcriptional activator/Tfp pilus assembly protein PilF